MHTDKHGTAQAAEDLVEKRYVITVTLGADTNRAQVKAAGKWYRASCSWNREEAARVCAAKIPGFRNPVIVNRSTTSDGQLLITVAGHQTTPVPRQQEYVCPFVVAQPAPKDRAGRLKAPSRELVVSDGITRGLKYMTCYRTPGRSLKRLVSPALPIRDTPVDAEADLVLYAQKRNWTIIRKGTTDAHG